MEVTIKIKYRPLYCILTDAEPLHLVRHHLILFDTHAHARHDMQKALEDVGRLYEIDYKIKVRITEMLLQFPEGGTVRFFALRDHQDIHRLQGGLFGSVDFSRCGFREARTFLLPRMYRSN